MFHPTLGRSRAQWERMRYCSARCANTWRAQQQRPSLVTMQRWAQAWEYQRRAQDRADLKTWKPKVWPHCRLMDKPTARRFLGWYCKSCGSSFVYYAKRAQSPYCVDCNEAHHRRPANRRAKQNGARYEVIVPRRVFERDNWRCQLCGRKTRGQFPKPLAPTVDHIVPLAAGGDHLYANVQCACFECNWRKAAGSANDQLRLAV